MNSLVVVFFSLEVNDSGYSCLSGFWNIKNCLERAIPATSSLQKQGYLTNRAYIKSKKNTRNSNIKFVNY